MTALSLFDHIGTSVLPSDAAYTIKNHLDKRGALRHRDLSALLTSLYGGSDAQGLWDWGLAHDAAEAAIGLMVKAKRRSLFGPKADIKRTIQTLNQFEALLPTRTRRTDETQTLQQFSTPLPLALAAVVAAQIKPGELVLEPSAGTGLMAVIAECYGARLTLNELGKTRSELLRGLFPHSLVTTHDAEAIDDLLPVEQNPSVVLMNPPFTHSNNSEVVSQRTTYRHIRSALARLQSGGRLVAITLNSFNPFNDTWRNAFDDLTQESTLSFSVGIEGRTFKKHGTGVDVRLHVFDKHKEPVKPQITSQSVDNPASLLFLINNSLLARKRTKQIVDKTASQIIPITRPLKQKTVKKVNPSPKRFTASRYGAVAPVAYTVKSWKPKAINDDQAIYESYTPQRINIDCAVDHPSALVQSAAMASVTPPKPTAKPILPVSAIEGGILSSAQLEITVYAEQAHSQFIDGQYIYDEDAERLKPAIEEKKPKPIRKGVFIGDGAGVGKGREISSIILSNFLAGRKKAAWISESATLLEDAQRDWCSLGGEKTEIVPLSKYKQADQINLSDGIIFSTFATLRTKGRNGSQDRVQQLIKWLGDDFDGVIVFDESHAMANAAGNRTERGIQKGSQQGKVGLHLQRKLPNARIVYASATGATEITNLAYAERLGLWLGSEFPFSSREDFINKMIKGGIAALEVVARDLKSLGLYFSRMLSFQGVEVELLTHTLTNRQVEIYNLYADAWKIIHNNLERALIVTNISDPDVTYNKDAKSAARSALEGNKQRFFNHLLTAMKMPTMIEAIEQDLASNRAPVIQLVSTSEALLKRRLDLIPPSEWKDIHVDVTPREYVIDYLMNAFPTLSYEIYSNEEGHECSRIMCDERGNQIHNQQALAMRDSLIEELCSLPPVQSALDQLLFYFGQEQVAEVTGRKLRLVKSDNVVSVNKRPANSNLAETDAFQNGIKAMLVFSNAGGTGRSYHADKTALNQKQCVHYMLEAGWQAYKAIQGLGRSNRSNQASKPIVRPVTTNVRGERRFISTIVKRLDSLGALTKGQRETGGQGLYNEEDNFESTYAKAALQSFYHQLNAGMIKACSITHFEDITGLSLRDSQSGNLRKELPPITRFLNRMLALRIETQNELFDAFESILRWYIQSAKENGTFERGVETLTGDSFTILEQSTIFQHECGTDTIAYRIERKTSINPRTLEDILQEADMTTQFVYNGQTNSYGLLKPTYTETNPQGQPEQMYIISRPHTTKHISGTGFAKSYWSTIRRDAFIAGWQEEQERRKHMVSEFWLVTGLLLPIWDKLGDETRIWRLQTQCNQRLLGRKMKTSEMANLQRKLSLNVNINISPAEVLKNIMQNDCKVDLAHGLQLRRVFRAGEQRLTVLGWDYDILQRLKAIGAMIEYHNHNMHCFLPTGNKAIFCIKQLLNFAAVKSIV